MAGLDVLDILPPLKIAKFKILARLKVSSPVAKAAVVPTVRFHKHHTVPKEILKKYLPLDVANHPLVRGQAGSPNRLSIPEDLHKAIHKGPGGGAYNEAFKIRLEDLGRKPTVEDVLKIKNELIEQFGLRGFQK